MLSDEDISFYMDFMGHLPDDLFKAVAIYGFNDMPYLTSVNIGNNIEYIANAFNYCDSLNCIFIPVSVGLIKDSFAETKDKLYYIWSQGIICGNIC